MRSLGQKRWLELLLTGELIDAETAYSWGLANRVVPRERLHEEAVALAESMAENSPVAVQSGKEASYAVADVRYEEALRFSNERFAAFCSTADAAEGIGTFLAGHEPDWPEA